MAVVVASAAYDDGAVAPMALTWIDAVRFPQLVPVWDGSKYHNHSLRWCV